MTTPIAALPLHAAGPYCTGAVARRDLIAATLHRGIPAVLLAYGTPFLSEQPAVY